MSSIPREEGHSFASPSIQPVKTFRYHKLRFSYTSNHHLLGLAEVCLLDIYRSGLLPSGGVVIDCGAGIGDYSIVASKSVGPRGAVLAIEPDPDDFQLLRRNLATNQCSNVLAINVGVAGHPGRRKLTYFDRELLFDVQTLDDVISAPTCKRFQAGPIAAVKVDIEGSEGELIQASRELMRRVCRLSIEIHGEQPLLDQTLIPMGFRFFPLGRRQARNKLLRSALRHPLTATGIYFATRKYHSHSLLSLLSGQLAIAEGNELQVGEYVRQ